MNKIISVLRGKPKPLRFKAKFHQWKFSYIGGTLANSTSYRPRFDRELPSFPLATARIGDRLIITHIKQNSIEKTTDKQYLEREFLDQKGFKPGQEIEVISQTNNGSVIVSLQNEQIGLGVAIANMVLVTSSVR